MEVTINIVSVQIECYALSRMLNTHPMLDLALFSS